MKAKLFRSALLCLLPLLLIACGGGVTGDANNYVVVEKQTLINLNEVQVTEVKLEESAWVVIYQSTGPQQLQGGSDDIIGVKSLDAGEYGPVAVELDRDVVDGELLYAELRKDAGLVGQFEPLGLDTVISQSATTAASFFVYLSEEPFLNLGSGEIHNNNFIVDKVVTRNQNWIVAYTYDEDAENNLGTLVSFHKLEPGHHRNVELALNLGGKSGIDLAVGNKLVIALYENTVDEADEDSFDSVNDEIVVAQGLPMLQSTELSLISSGIN